MVRTFEPYLALIVLIVIIFPLGIFSFSLESPGAIITIVFGQLDPNADEDGDSLLNSWEQLGIDMNNDGVVDLNLKALRANPLHKDIFVEVDYMQFHRPNELAIDNVTDSFADAPLINPDGNRGISLHVLVDEQIPHQDFSGIPELKNIKYSRMGTLEDRIDPNHSNIIAAKNLIFHYALFAHHLPPLHGHIIGNSGTSPDTPGMEFMITLGNSFWGIDPSTGHHVGSIDQQEGTFMHELGHNLGLHHGGTDGLNNKPNYLSVMNYLFQTSSLVRDRPLDYSRCSLSALNENSLLEPHGIGVTCPAGLTTYIECPPHTVSTLSTTRLTPVDFNNDGDVEDNPLALDLTCYDGLSILNGHEDWTNIKYHSIGLEGSQNSSNIPVIMQREFSVDDLINHRLALLQELDNAMGNLSASSFIDNDLSSLMPENFIAITNTNTSNIAKSLANNQLDDAIGNLTKLRTTIASPLLAVSPNYSKVDSLIDNLIGVLEKQK